MASLSILLALQPQPPFPYYPCPLCVPDPPLLQAAVANTPITSSYHLLAVQPQTERAFALACSSLDVDIISLDLSRRLPYRFKPALVKAAIARGLQFEVCLWAKRGSGGAGAWWRSAPKR